MVVQQQLKLSIEESHCANDCFAQGGGEKQFVEHLQLGQSLAFLSPHVAVRLFAAVVGRLGDLMARQTSVMVLPWATSCSAVHCFAYPSAKTPECTTRICVACVPWCSPRPSLD